MSTKRNTALIIRISNILYNIGKQSGGNQENGTDLSPGGEDLIILLP